MEKRQKLENVISLLPLVLIDEVMERLPLLDAAYISILSHQWFSSWPSIRTLELNRQFIMEVFRNRVLDANGFSRLVSKLLLQYYDPGKLRRFQVYIPGFPALDSQSHLDVDVDQWISYLSRTGVSDIYIENRNYFCYMLSHSLFSIKKLEKLSIRGFKMITPETFNGFENLTLLDIINFLWPIAH
ncbi:F-box/FBD/LRR-repeat protein At1g13570-like [Silene latifolia]|uniref:F-box/FBD/LRR-repeat protein At1g13570-like n=1 Tax=Silene latifolia TaxID=37657 RepID=UPI003D784E6C